MSGKKIESIKRRLLEIERERESLLSELSAFQSPSGGKSDFPLSGPPAKKSAPPAGNDEKVSLFLDLFAGRKDVFAKLWESKKSGRKGWSPVCSNEWAPGICEKPKVKCAECPSQSFEPLNSQTVRRHLRGGITAGVYAIGQDSTCKFLAVDFDGANWSGDLLLFKKEGKKLGADVALERSQSGNGGHAWIFFSEPVPAAMARRLGSIIMTQAMKQSPLSKFSSYDRFFPNQDFLPKGGFGNLIALPLQKAAREKGCAVFIDENLRPLPDQWAYLSSIRRMPLLELSRLTEGFSGRRETLPRKPTDKSAEDENQLWSESSLSALSKSEKSQFAGAKAEAELFSQIKIKTEGLPAQLIFSLKRQAVFANPEFFQRQKMRFSTWNIPRYIFCGEQTKSALILPGGLVDSCREICAEGGAEFNIKDRRPRWKKIKVRFKGKLERDQERALIAMLRHERGVLTAPPGSGKTVIGCALITKRKLPALVLVHRSSLCGQWKEKLSEFASLPGGEIGMIAGQDKRVKGKIDVAMMQTIGKMKKPESFLARYGQIIIDECHHIPARVFEAVVKKSPAMYISGLTATPYRKDGLQPIIYMQCGPVRHKIAEKSAVFESKRVIARASRFKLPEEEGPHPPLHKVWDGLVKDEQRRKLIAGDLTGCLDEGRIPLLISDRKEHLQLLKTAVSGESGSGSHIFVLHGGLSKTKRSQALKSIRRRLERKQPVCLLATGSLIGEGFDLPALDTLFLAMPIAFSGRLVQYAGRLHRPLEGKKEIRIYDYVDAGSGLTVSMFKKRIKVYRRMGYRIESDLTLDIEKDPRQSSFFA